MLINIRRWRKVHRIGANFQVSSSARLEALNPLSDCGLPYYLPSDISKRLTPNFVVRNRGAGGWKLEECKRKFACRIWSWWLRWRRRGSLVGWRAALGESQLRPKVGGGIEN
jgi:hypothetical protein